MNLAVTLIVLLPLLAAAIAGFFGRAIGDRAAQVITTGALLVAAVLSIFVFIRVGFGPEAAKKLVVPIVPWIVSGTFDVSWALRVDALTAVMLIVVTGVSSMVHLYSVGYMAEDRSIPRFMSYLSLFTFFMLMLVTYHAWTWFKIMPKTLPRIPLSDRTVVILGVTSVVLVSAGLLWIA